MHTFNHRFAQDPALAFQEGLTAALRDGHCALSSPSTTDLQVVLVKMEAHGEACGFVSCDGTAQAEVSVTLLDASGRTLSQQVVSTTANDGCGMSFCNEEESSNLATRAIFALLRDDATRVAVLPVGDVAEPLTHTTDASTGGSLPGKVSGTSIASPTVRASSATSSTAAGQ